MGLKSHYNSATMNVTISLAQFRVALAQPEANVKKAHEFVAAAAARNSALVLLPELWTSGYDLDHAARHSEQNQLILTEIERWAREYNLIIGGTMITGTAGNFRNTFQLVVPGSPALVTYDKVHLFRMLREDQFFKGGDKLVCTDLGWAVAGLATCYDLRFPEMFRNLALKGAEIFLISSQWGRRRAEHWKVFLRARAIENQVFIAAVNSTGTVQENEFAGHSAIVDPWGDVITSAKFEETLLTAQINLDEIARNRELLPVYQDRRPDIYA